MHRNKLILFIGLALFTLYWILSSESHHFSRDEGWYSNYSIYWDDTETEDVRHVIDDDIHQLAYLPIYRALLRCNLSVFGYNVFGIRVWNLIISIVMLIVLFKVLEKTGLDIRAWIVFAILISMVHWTAESMHNARPDWTMACLGSMSIMMLMLFLHEGRRLYVFISIVLASLSLAVYWSGLLWLLV